jgi:hypothetical protein
MTIQELTEASALDQTNEQDKGAKHPSTDRKQFGCKDGIVKINLRYWYNGIKNRAIMLHT